MITKIHKAINEGLELMSFDDDLGFDKQEISSAVNKGNQKMMVTIIEERIKNDKLFIPNAISYKPEVILYNDNTIVIRLPSSSKYILSAIEILPNDGGCTLNISLFLGNIACDNYFYKIMADIKELNKDFNVNYNQCTIYGESYIIKKTVTQTFTGEIVTVSDYLPKKLLFLSIVDSDINSPDLIKINKEIDQSHVVIIIDGTEDYTEVEVSLLKQTIRRFNAIGYKYVMAATSLFGYKRSVFCDNLYYDYDTPTLELDIKDYGLIFDQKRSAKIGLIILKEYGRVSRVKNKTFMELGDEEKLVKLINDGNIQKLGLFIRTKITDFAYSFWNLLIPFYKGLLEYDIETNRIQSTHKFVGYQFFPIGYIIEPIIRHIDETGYTKNEIMDMIDTACRFIMKYGNIKACKMCLKN